MVLSFSVSNHVMFSKSVTDWSLYICCSVHSQTARCAVVLLLCILVTNPHISLWKWIIKRGNWWDFLVVQWLGLHASTAENTGLISGLGTKILHGMCCDQKRKEGTGQQRWKCSKEKMWIFCCTAQITAGFRSSVNLVLEEISEEPHMYFNDLVTLLKSLIFFLNICFVNEVS